MAKHPPAEKADARKARLRETLLVLAEEQIAADGLGSLKARALAAKAGIAVGGIYTHFEDMQALVLEVNGRTFRKLGAEVARAVEAADGLGPTARLIEMSKAYLSFAAHHTALWRALFDVEMTGDTGAPQWYLDALEGLLGFIAEPLAELLPDMSRKERALMTRALFSSVHGIVLLGLERRISGVPTDQIETMLAQVLSRIAPAQAPGKKKVVKKKKD